MLYNFAIVIIIIGISSYIYNLKNKHYYDEENCSTFRFASVIITEIAWKLCLLGLFVCLIFASFYR
ncbi:hypothetical protein C0583_06565 [Candidatus Parcubacteria bacterium]|nr:MAG: hypothetical protein C0583_06565 [Candidatus Parcubacteria bacterium]